MLQEKVIFPDIPEAITCGETREEALLQAVDCLETALAFKVKESETIPLPSKRKRGMVNIAVSSLVAAKVLLYLEMK